MKKWLSNNRWDLLAWVASLLLLGWSLYPLLHNKILPGWDTTPHFYLLTKMVEFMKMGRITGYDTLWFGGFPAFTFYGPLPYVIMALLFLGSGGLIGIALAFNLFIFALPFLFLAALYYTGRIWFGKNAGPLILIFGSFFLTTVREYAYVGTGINSMIAIGLFSSFFALCLMIFFLGVMRKSLKNQEIPGQLKYLIWGAILLSMLLLTHAMTTLFTLLLLGIFTLMNWKKFWKSAMIMGFGALILSSWWLIPFLKNLSLSSGQKLGMMGTGNDPLFVLFSFPTRLGEHSTAMFFSMLPVLLLLVCSVTGIVSSIRGKQGFFAWSFLLTLILLPAEYLPAYLNLPVHYYRFIAPIYVLNIFLATAGALYLFSAVRKAGKFAAQILRGCLVGIMIASVAVSYLDHLNLSENYRNYRHKYNFEEYPDTANAQKMISYLAGRQIENRMVVSTMPYFQESLGSPHYFGTFLPLQLKIAVIPGLLAESALSTQFVMPVLAKIGSSLNWGESALLNDYRFSSQDMNSMIKRLGLYNVEYLLVTKDVAANLLNAVDRKMIVNEQEIENFSLLKLRDFRPLIETTSYKPFLYIDGGGIDFLSFSKEWFKLPDLFEMPVIYTEREPEDLPMAELEQIGGFIVSLEEGEIVDSGEMEEWLGYGKKLIFLNGVADGVDENVKFLSQFGVNIGIEELSQTLEKFGSRKISRKKVQPEIREGMKLKFQSNGGTLINYSYFPNWKSSDPDQTIYWATPSMMWVFGRGAVEMHYE